MKRIRFGLLLLGFIQILAQAQLNTASIAAYTMAAAPHCVQYRIIGICYWLNKWGMNTTLKLSHYVPDLVVTVFNQLGDDPWFEANNSYDPAAYETGNQQIQAESKETMAGGQSGKGDSADNDTHFKEVDVIGNPVAKSLFGYKILLPSQATPFFPYYLSMADATLWRSAWWEAALHPEFLVPGLHDIGQWPSNTWGMVYPRIGFIIQANDAKAAAVTALRAAHIVTRENQLHFYKSLSNSCGSHCTAAPVTENSDDTHWQMLSPLPSHECEIFAAHEGVEQWGIDAAKVAKGAYAFNVWRHYSGCIQGEGKYIGSVNF